MLNSTLSSEARRALRVLTAAAVFVFVIISIEGTGLFDMEHAAAQEPEVPDWTEEQWDALGEYLDAVDPPPEPVVPEVPEVPDWTEEQWDALGEYLDAVDPPPEPVVPEVPEVPDWTEEQWDALGEYLDAVDPPPEPVVPEVPDHTPTLDSLEQIGENGEPYVPPEQGTFITVTAAHNRELTVTYNCTTCEPPEQVVEVCTLVQGYNDLKGGCQPPSGDGHTYTETETEYDPPESEFFELSICGGGGDGSNDFLVNSDGSYLDGSGFCGGTGIPPALPPPETVTVTVTDPVTNIETVTETVTVTDPVTNIETVTETETVTDPVTNIETVTETETVTDPVTNIETVTETVTVVDPVVEPSQPTIEWGAVPSSVREGGTITLRLVSDSPVANNLEVAVWFFASEADAGDIAPDASCGPASGRPLVMTIPAGQRSVDCAVTAVRNDDDGDGDVDDGVSFIETVGLWKVEPAGETTNLGNAALSFNIRDNDQSSVVSISAASPVDEGGSLSYAVSLASAALTTVTVDWATTSGGTAFAGTDYRSGSGTVTFAAGETSKTVAVATLTDMNSGEPDETVIVELSNANVATLGTATASGTIRDVPVPPVVSMASTALSVAETNSSGVSITAVLNKPATRLSSVTVTATGAARGAGSCYAGVEFYLSASTFSFSVGADRASITLYPCSDADYNNETINVTLSSVGIAGLTVGSPTTTQVTILDPEPVVSITGPVSVDESAGTATFTVEVPAAATSAVSVTVNTSNGTATAGSDYTAVVNRLVTIGVGSRSATVSVTIIDDATVEPDETFTVTLTNPTNATLGTVTATGTIRNDDVPPPTTTTVPGPGF